MAHRHLDYLGLGVLRHSVLRHHRHAQGETHLRGQLVLWRVYLGGGLVARGEQH